jgi:hypothetical protein
MNKAEKRQESERLRDVLTHIRDHLDVLVEHLEEDVLPPRMVAASAHHLMAAAMAGPSFTFLSTLGRDDLEGHQDRRRRGQ